MEKKVILSIIVILILCVFSFFFNYAVLNKDKFSLDSSDIVMYKVSVNIYNSIKEQDLRSFYYTYVHEFSYNNSPLLVFQTIPFYAIFGVSQDTAILSNIVHIVLIACLSYLLIRKLTKDYIGLLTSILFVFLTLIYPFLRTYNPLFVMSSMYFSSITFLLLSNHFRKRPYSILLGISVGLGFLTGYIFLIFILPLFLVYILFYFTTNIKKGWDILSRDQSVNIGIAFLFVLLLAGLWYPIKSNYLFFSVFQLGGINFPLFYLDSLNTIFTQPIIFLFILSFFFISLKVYFKKPLWAWIYVASIFSFLILLIISPELVFEYFIVFFPLIIFFIGILINDIIKLVESRLSTFDDIGSRELMDLKKLPFPTYEELDLSQYTDKIIGMSFSRGCIGTCAFCEDKLFQGRYRTRNPKDVVEELKYHVENNGISHFWFHDLAINGDNKKLEELCDLIIGEKLDIKWIALAIARKDTTKRLLKKMRKAGCYTLNYGIESGSNSVLKKMDKYKLFSAKDAERIMRWTSEAGINVQPNFIVGFPGETELEFEETLEFIKRNQQNISGITNINTCLIPKNSPAGLYPEKFGIVGGINEKNQMDWETEELDYKIRLERAKRTKELAQELGYDIYFTNLSQQDLDNI